MKSPEDRVSIEDLDHHREGVANVLLLAPAETETDVDACLHLLGNPDSESTHVLSLGYSAPPEHTTRAVRRAGLDSTSDTTFVCIGDTTRSAGSAAFSPSSTSPNATTVQVVEDPADLAGIGIAVNDWLDRWDDGHQTVICFHSLTALLDHVDVQSAFRFLHVLTGRVATADACAHYHLDPSAHDEQAVRTLSMLFDEIVSVDA